MKIQKYLVTVILFILTGSIQSATIQGKITDGWSGVDLIGANVLIKSQELGAATDAEGNYFIKNVKPGTYIVISHYIGYDRHYDTVEVKSEDETIILDIQLRPALYLLEEVTTPEIENYHKRIEILNKKKPVIEILVDSLELVNNLYLNIDFSIKNTTNEMIYIFKDYPCFTVIKLVVIDSLGKKMRDQRIISDCLGMKTCPDFTDVITINPGETIKYDKTNLNRYNWGKFGYPPGKYTVQVNYNFPKPELISKIACSQNDNLEAMLKGLRGSYLSKKITIDVKKEKENKQEH